MKEELCCIRFSGSKKFVGTYEECVAVADEVYRKTRVVLGIVKYNKKLNEQASKGHCPDR